MADLSKIKLNGTVYNFKDNYARTNFQTAAQVNTAIATAMGEGSSFSIDVVESLPATGEQGTFYFVGNSGSGQNIYDEYVYVNNNWEKIGTTEVDLSNYLQTSDIADWAKAATKPAYTASEVGAVSTTAPAAAITNSDITNWNNKLSSYTETDPTVPPWAKASTKPSYTASEVGAAATSHDHGKLKSDGRIITSLDIQSGDKLVIVDTDQNSTINGSSITFGSSTTQFLANNGTWKSVSVTQTLTSGTAIGSVQGTTLYAPNPYNDTALTNRVSALESKDTTLENRIAAIENLEWAKYYSGQSNPASSLGENGDIYLQY